MLYLLIITIKKANMLIVISPSKTQDFSKSFESKTHTIPVFLKESQELITILKTYKLTDLLHLLKVNKSLAELNYKRIKNWDILHPEKKSKTAVLAFKGGAFKNLKAHTFTTSDFEFSSLHIRILSGLYGLLRPLDYIMPHRLEMGTNISNFYGKNLYKFWNEKITFELNRIAKENNFKTLINLASGEYFKAINTKSIDIKVVNITFMQQQNGAYKVLGVFSKKARGKMVNFIVKNRIIELSELKLFNNDGYVFNPKLSSEQEMVYTR